MSEVLERLAYALWAADVKRGNMPTQWRELDEIARVSYREDADALLWAVALVGIKIEGERS